MKKTLAIFLLFFFIALSGNSPKEVKASVDSIETYRDIPGVTADEISAIEQLKADRNILTYGHLFEMEDLRLMGGTHTGFTYESTKLLSELFGIEFTQIPYGSWQQLKVDLDNNNIDFTSDLTPNAENKQHYYITEPIADREQQLITLAGTDLMTEADVNGLKLGFLENSVNIEPILRRYPDLSFEAVYVDYISSIEGMLVSGAIDAFVTERNLEAFFEESDRIQVKSFFPLAYTSISLSTANADLSPVISVVNKYLESGGIEKLNHLYEQAQYEYTKHRLVKSLTDDELAYIKNLSESGQGVYIALQNDNYPFSFYNETEMEFQGVAVDILDDISKLTGISFINTSTPESLWTDSLNDLQTGQVSIVSQLGYAEARKEHYIWSDTPYAISKYALISKADFPKVESYQIQRLKVGVTEDSIYKEVFEVWFPDSNNLVLYPSHNDTLDALEKGEVDLIMGAENLLLMQINYRENTGFIINYFFNTNMESMFGFNKNDDMLRSIISKAQRHVGVESIESYWKSRVFDYSKVIGRMQTLYLSIFSAVMLAVLIAVTALFIKNNRLRKQLLGHSNTISTIYDAIPDLVFSKDINGVYTSCNSSFEKFTGLTKGELIGKKDEDIMIHDPEAAEQKAKADARVIANNMQEMVEETLVYPDNSRRLLEMLRVPMIRDEKTVGILGIGRDVTERKEVKSRIERIINTAQIAFLLTIDGIVIEANEYSTRHIGAKVGDDILQFYSVRGQRDTIIKIAEEQGTASNVIVNFNTVNGESHRFLANFTFVEYEQRKAYLVWAIDIESEERKEEQLYAAHQSFQSVLDALPMPVRIVDVESSEIVYVNDSILELLEYDSTTELCGLNILDILPDKLADGTSSAERVKLMMDSESFISVEIEYLTKAGRRIEAIVVSRRIDYQGRPSSIGIIKDLTAEKEKERILMDAAEREKEANQAKSRFLANMSHEIRTPMNGVIGMTDLLLGEQLSGRQHQYVRDIKISAESLLNIINDILDLSKISEGRLQIVPVDTDLSMLLKNTVSMMSFTAHSKGLDFIDDIQISTPEYIHIDDVRLKQVIVNLLSNAIKFTSEGYVKLSARIENDSILFEVVDTGIGIKEDELPLIYMAFEQADKRKNHAIKGTGLGLSISKNLVTLMGGNLWVESEYGKGTTFFVSVPYVQGDETAVYATDTVFEYISAPMAKVLLVDDIQTNLTVGAGLMRLCKITADIAISGHDAISLVSAKDYDIVFMDHMMPEMDGIEATQLIRNMGEKYRNLPIIALTANAVNESKDLLLSSGMDDFLSKPIDKDALMGILKKWLPADKIEIDTSQDDTLTAVQYSKVLEEVSRINGVDIKLALSRISGMQDVLEESIKQTAFSITEKLKRMDTFLDKGDLRGFGIEAHGLKGALANIGATRHSELAAELEIAAKADNMPHCVEKFSVFADAMMGFARELKSVFSYVSNESRLPGDSQLLQKKVGEAIIFLDSFEAPDALKCLHELEVFTFGEETDAKLREALGLIRSFKHKKAGAILKDIL